MINNIVSEFIEADEHIKHMIGAISATLSSAFKNQAIQDVKSVYKKFRKTKKPQAIKKLNDKEQRWMKDKEHKTSRQIVDFAIQEGVRTITIRRQARSRKNEKNLHKCSFYGLAQYIEYKAELSEIKVGYVDSQYTSQTCPEC